MDISTKIAEQLADAARAKRKQKRADKKTLRKEAAHPSNTTGSKKVREAQQRLNAGKTRIGILSGGSGGVSFPNTLKQ